MKKEVIKFSLRVDSKTYKKIQYISEKNKRSINGQLDFIIESYIEKFEEVNGKIKITEE